MYSTFFTVAPVGMVESTGELNIPTPEPPYLLEPFLMTTTKNPPLLADQLVDMVFITTFTGMTDKWFYKLIQDGAFPKPIKLGRSSRWRKSEVENWMQQRIAQSRS